MILLISYEYSYNSTLNMYENLKCSYLHPSNYHILEYMLALS